MGKGNGVQYISKMTWPCSIFKRVQFLFVIIRLSSPLIWFCSNWWMRVSTHKTNFPIWLIISRASHGSWRIVSSFPLPWAFKIWIGFESRRAYSWGRHSVLSPKEREFHAFSRKQNQRVFSFSSLFVLEKHGKDLIRDTGGKIYALKHTIVQIDIKRNYSMTLLTWRMTCVVSRCVPPLCWPKTVKLRASHRQAFIRLWLWLQLKRTVGMLILGISFSSTS